MLRKDDVIENGDGRFIFVGKDRCRFTTDSGKESARTYWNFIKNGVTLSLSPLEVRRLFGAST